MHATAKRIDLRAQIGRMVRRIARTFRPERIILFGSQARGDAGPDSDVDLLVVMPTNGRRWEIADAMHLALDDITVPKDIIVTSPEDFAWRKEIVGTVEWPAAHEGKLLYETCASTHGPLQPKKVIVMSYSQQVITAIREWLEKADNDLKAATQILTLKAEAPTDTVCFHAQHKAETESIRRYGLPGCLRFAHNWDSGAFEAGRLARSEAFGSCTRR